MARRKKVDTTAEVVEPVVNRSTRLAYTRSRSHQTKSQELKEPDEPAEKGQTAVEDTEAEIITESGIMGEGSDGDDEEEPNETEEDNKKPQTVNVRRSGREGKGKGGRVEQAEKVEAKISHVKRSSANIDISAYQTLVENKKRFAKEKGTKGRTMANIADPECPGSDHSKEHVSGRVAEFSIHPSTLEAAVSKKPTGRPRPRPLSKASNTKKVPIAARQTSIIDNGFDSPLTEESACESGQPTKRAKTVISDSESSGTERNPIDELTLGDNATISHAPVSSTKTVAALNHATSSSPEEFMTLRRNFAFSNWDALSDEEKQFWVDYLGGLNKKGPATTETPQKQFGFGQPLNPTQNGSVTRIEEPEDGMQISRSTAITLGKVKNGEKKKWGNAPPNPDLLALHPVAISISSSVEQIPTPVNREQFTKRCVSKRIESEAVVLQKKSAKKSVVADMSFGQPQNSESEYNMKVDTTLSSPYSAPAPKLASLALTKKSKKRKKSDSDNKAKEEDPLLGEEAVTDFAKNLLLAQLCSGHSFPSNTALLSLIPVFISQATHELSLGETDQDVQVYVDCQSIKSAIKSVISRFRSDVKKKARELTDSVYGMDGRILKEDEDDDLVDEELVSSEDDSPAIKQYKEEQRRVERIKMRVIALIGEKGAEESISFLHGKPDGEGDSEGFFAHCAVSKFVTEFFFGRATAVGIIHRDNAAFKQVPKAMLALVCAALRNSIDECRSGKREMIPFSRDPYGPDKTEYLTFYNKILATLTTMETTYAQHHQKLRERQREWIKKGRRIMACPSKEDQGERVEGFNIFGSRA